MECEAPAVRQPAPAERGPNRISVVGRAVEGVALTHETDASLMAFIGLDVQRLDLTLPFDLRPHREWTLLDWGGTA